MFGMWYLPVLTGKISSRPNPRHRVQLQITDFFAPKGRKGWRCLYSRATSVGDTFPQELHLLCWVATRHTYRGRTSCFLWKRAERNRDLRRYLTRRDVLLILQCFTESDVELKPNSNCMTYFRRGKWVFSCAVVTCTAMLFSTPPKSQYKNFPSIPSQGNDVP